MNKTYANFVLASKIEEYLLTKFNPANFMNVNNSLTATPGMTYNVNTYTATGDVETLGLGEGNTDYIESEYTQKEYVVELAQGRTHWFDEEAMTDPIVVDSNLLKLSAQIYNKDVKDFYGELHKGTQIKYVEKFDYASIVRARTLLNVEENPQLSLLCSFNDAAELQIEMEDHLKFVEAYAGNVDYIGHVAGIPVYQNKYQEDGEIDMLTKEAVTKFNKKGIEVEQDREPNTRHNIVYGRNVRVIALTDDTKLVRIIKGEEPTPSVTLDKETATVAAGATTTLTATTVPAGETVTWESSDETAATVEGGVVTGVAEGTANITATITVDGTDYTDTCAVTVTAAQVNG